jgi:hypothetical protein
MPKKPRKRPAKPAPVSWWRVVRVLPAAAAVVGLFAGLRWVSVQAGAQVAAKERYAVRVADLRVNTPPQTDVAKFLTEVKLLGRLPDTVQAVDPGLPGQLGEAFRLHPWVEDVTAVAVEPDGGVRVEVKFRSPALAVRWSATTRAVTATGVLLPVGTPTTGLPLLVNDRTVKDAADGRPWPEPDVIRAAELATRHPCKTVERTRTGWRLTDADGKALVIETP